MRKVAQLFADPSRFVGPTCSVAEAEADPSTHPRPNARYGDSVKTVDDGSGRSGYMRPVTAFFFFFRFVGRTQNSRANRSSACIDIRPRDTF